MRSIDGGLNVLLCVATFLVLTLYGCASEEPLQFASPLPRSSKEYELYSWKSDGTWYFTLITGTNRLKTHAEITSPENIEEGDWVKITAVGVPELKSVLGRLPPGSQVFWHSARRLDPSTLTSEPDIRRPPGRLVREVRSYCAELDLTLERSR